MSNRLHMGLKQVVGAFTMMTTVLSLSGIVALTPAVAHAVAPADYGLHEGDTISAIGSNDPDIYIVNDWGYKRLFVNPAIFNLYGHLSWAGVKSVAPATRDAFGTSGLFRNCETNDQKVYGLDVISEDVANLRWINTSGAQAVIDDPNFFKKVFCINSNEMALYGRGADYTSVLQVPVYTRGGQVSGPFSASLASDNPASGVLLETQSMADLAHFAISGSGKVTKVSLKRLGISGDSTLSSVYLFVNGARVSDGNTFADSTVTFNDANGFCNAACTISVRGTVAASTSGQTVGVQIVSVNDVAVSATGNIHSIAAVSGASLSTVALSGLTATGNLDPKADVTVWQVSAQVSTNEVYLKRLTLREIGSINYADLQNFRLFVDGVQKATAPGLDANGLVSFVLNEYLNQANHTFRVVADVVGGASRTFSFKLNGAYDMDLIDADYNVGVAATGASVLNTATTAATVSGTPSVDVVKATDSPSGDRVDASTNVLLAKYTAKAYGENVKVDDLYVTASVSNNGETAVTGLRNGRVVINGLQVGSTKTLTSGTAVAFTINHTFPVGVLETIEVYADLKDSAATDQVSNGDTIVVTLPLGVNNGQGVSSGVATIDVPGADKAGNVITVATGAMTLVKNSGYANQTVVLPQSAFKIGAWTLTGPATEGVNVNTMTINIDESAGTTFDYDDLTSMYIKYGSNMTSTQPTVTAASNSYSVSFTLGVNEVMPIELYANLGTTVTSTDSFIPSLKVYGTTSSSGVAVTQGLIAGQTIAQGVGSLTVAVDPDTAVARIVADNQSIDAAKFRFTAVNETYKPSTLVFGLASVAGITSATVTDGTTTLPLTIGTASASVNLSPAQQEAMKFVAGTAKTLTVSLVLSSVETPNGAGTGLNHAVTFDASSSKAVLGSTGVESTFTTLSQTNKSGNPQYTYAAIPTISRIALPSSLLSNGTATLAKWSVSSSGTGTIGWIKTIFTIAQSGAVTAPSSLSVWDADSNTQIAGDIASSGGTVTFTATNEQEISGAKNYYLKGTIAATDGVSDSVVTTLGAGSTQFGASAASSSAATAGAGTASFVWTDQSIKSPHTESTLDWNNSWLVKNLPLDSWTLSN